MGCEARSAALADKNRNESSRFDSRNKHRWRKPIGSPVRPDLPQPLAACAVEIATITGFGFSFFCHVGLIIAPFFPRTVSFETFGRRILRRFSFPLKRIPSRRWHDTSNAFRPVAPYTNCDPTPRRTGAKLEPPAGA